MKIKSLKKENTKSKHGSFKTTFTHLTEEESVKINGGLGNPDFGDGLGSAFGNNSFGGLESVNNNFTNGLGGPNLRNSFAGSLGYQGKTSGTNHEAKISGADPFEEQKAQNKRDESYFDKSLISPENPLGLKAVVITATPIKKPKYSYSPPSNNNYDAEEERRRLQGLEELDQVRLYQLQYEQWEAAQEAAAAAARKKVAEEGVRQMCKGYLCLYIVGGIVDEAPRIKQAKIESRNDGVDYDAGIIPGCCQDGKIILE